MADSRDNRSGLEDCPFSYQTTKQGQVFVFWRGKRVMILKTKKADAFLQRMNGMSLNEQQLAMAKITGNFKRGNEH